MITKHLVQHLVSQFKLPTTSIHGPGHWARVLENGRNLAEKTGACLSVVEYFAVFHDSCRCTDGRDPDHGRRGAELAAALRGSLFQLSGNDFALLDYACTHHTRGLVDGDITVQTCWDSDRLDLPRAMVHINPDRLCTSAARDRAMIRWAVERSSQHMVLTDQLEEWGLDLKGRIITNA